MHVRCSSPEISPFPFFLTKSRGFLSFFLQIHFFLLGIPPNGPVSFWIKIFLVFPPCSFCLIFQFFFRSIYFPCLTGGLGKNAQPPIVPSLDDAFFMNFPSTVSCFFILLIFLMYVDTSSLYTAATWALPLDLPLPPTEQPYAQIAIFPSPYYSPQAILISRDRIDPTNCPYSPPRSSPDELLDRVNLPRLCPCRPHRYLPPIHGLLLRAPDLRFFLPLLRTILSFPVFRMSPPRSPPFNYFLPFFEERTVRLSTHGAGPLFNFPFSSGAPHRRITSLYTLPEWKTTPLRSLPFSEPRGTFPLIFSLHPPLTSLTAIPPRRRCASCVMNFPFQPRPSSPGYLPQRLHPGSIDFFSSLPPW